MTKDQQATLTGCLALISGTALSVGSLVDPHGNDILAGLGAVLVVLGVFWLYVSTA